MPRSRRIRSGHQSGAETQGSRAATLVTADGQALLRYGSTDGVCSSFRLDRQYFQTADITISCMTLPSRLTFHAASYRPDGGTTTLCATDEHGLEHCVLLPRNIDSNLSQTTGQLYFDGELVPVRSLFESNLLRLFNEAQLVPGSISEPGALRLDPPIGVAGDDFRRLLDSQPVKRLRWLLDSVIAYVESDAYGSSGTPPAHTHALEAE